MTILERAGRALYGPGDSWRDIRWDLELNERTFRRMVNGQREIPESLLLELERMLRERATTIDNILGNMADASDVSRA